MKTDKLFFKIFLIISAVLLVGFFFSLFADKKEFSGPFLAFFFITMAISAYGFDNMKKFAYTLWIFAAVSISMSYPQYFRSVGDFDLKKLIVPLLQIIMFGMGSQLSVKNFRDVIKMPKGVIIGVICQFSIMPLVGISLATVFGFPPEVAAGVVLIGSSPSGLASNVMSFIAKANLALSVTLTTVATLLAPVMTPLLMKILAGHFVPIHFWKMMLSIINMVILPVVAGLLFHAMGYGKEKRKSIIIQFLVYLLIIGLKNYINYSINAITLAEQLVLFLKDVFWFSILPAIAAIFFNRYSKGRSSWLDSILSFLSMAGIAVIITIITAAGRDSLMKIGIALVFASLIHNLGGYFLGYWLCRLFRMDEQSCRTISLEVGMQNGGLASGIALEMGRVATIGLAPAVFGPMMNITGSSLANWWRGKPVKTNKN